MANVENQKRPNLVTIKTRQTFSKDGMVGSNKKLYGDSSLGLSKEKFLEMIADLYDKTQEPLTCGYFVFEIWVSSLALSPDDV